MTFLYKIQRTRPVLTWVFAVLRAFDLLLWMRFNHFKKNKTGNARYNVTLWRVVQPLLQWKINEYYIFWVCVCSLGYTAWSAHEPFYLVWPVRLYSIFPHYFNNCTIFEKKKSLNMQYVLWFSLQILSLTFLILRKTERDMINKVYRSSCKVSANLVRFYRNLNFSTYFRELLKHNISWKSVQWEPSCSMRTDGRTDMTKLIVAFQNCTNAPKNRTWVKVKYSFRTAQ